MIKKDKQIRRLSRLLLFSGCLLCSTLWLSAQDTEAATPPSASNDSATLIGAFHRGGLAMYPLLAFSIATVGLIIYNGLSIREKTLIGRDVLKNEVSPALESHDFKKAMEICERHPTPLLNILHNGLETTKSGRFEADTVDRAFDEAASVELGRPFVFINYLQVIASVSPMVGLLGTVSGMVKAFRTISEQGMGRPELLADNISEALITTASGLMVAIPALIAYFYFKNKYGKIAAEVSQLLGRTLRLVTHKESGTANTAQA